MTESRLRIAVIGGGIAGLTFAYALSQRRKDVEINVYEANANTNEFGAGLNLMPRVVEVLQKMGLEEDLKHYAGEPTADTRFQYFKGDQPNALWYGRSTIGPKAIHRAEFLRLLVKNTTSVCTTHFSKKLVSYDDPADGMICLHFKDGSTATCDVLIGGDGVKSAVRAQMYRHMAEVASRNNRPVEEVEKLLNYVDPKWCGEVIYRGIIPADVLQTNVAEHPSLKSPTYFVGKSKFIITYPIVQGTTRLINVGAVVAQHEYNGTTYDGPWSAVVDQKELLEQFEGWDKQAQALLNLMKTPSRWVVNSVDNLPSFVGSRVVIIGDAAHSMTPHQASGAGQAVEDAFLLASLLGQSSATVNAIPRVLQVYDKVRRPVAQEVHRRSYETGRMLMLETLTSEMDSSGMIPLERLTRHHEEVQAMYQWNFTSALDDLTKAENELHTQAQLLVQ
ncbi:FAD/NAD(P)-binding domain-containing protein [Cristinia sonorae]|uniref:FAD/NAD(P)-binding domain-containing protein n=1 Tax=Cristinia sonorae TaxID=1940300 RepID=A0A8K0UF66_9AGAR|nr:FAD/NAD(P)-binding domain-containing protein [Cristinia sonorae]